MTTTVVRPTSTGLRKDIATVMPGNVVTLSPGTTYGNGPGTAPHDILANTGAANGTSNSTFCWGSANTGEVRLGFTAAPVTFDGVSNRLVSVQIGAVYAHEGTDIGHAEDVTARLRSPDRPLATQGNPPHELITASSSFQASTSPDYKTRDFSAPGGIPWTQAILARLQAQLYWHSSANNKFLKVSELYLLFETCARPVVSALSVTGTTTSAMPTFSFTYTGDPTQTDLPSTQTSLEYKVFPLATTTAAGFNADTSAFVAQEVIPDNITTKQISTPLNNTASYKIYVRAGQKWSGPEGAVWYSAWVASSTFTISLTTPAAPTITVDQQLGLPWYRNRVTVNLDGVNLLTKDASDFENGVGGWTWQSNANTPVSDGTHLSGSFGLKWTAQTTGSSAVALRQDPGVPVVGGQLYTGMISVKIPGTARTFSAGLRWDDASGANITEHYGPGTLANSSTHTTGYVVRRAPYNAVRAHLVIIVWAPVVAAEIYYADEAAIYSSTNLLSLASEGFEDGTVGSWVGGNSTLAASTSNALTGSYKMIMTSTIASSVVAYIHGIAVQPSTGYLWNVSVQAVATPRNFDVLMQYYDPGNGYISAAGGAATPVGTAGYSTLQWGATTPANAATIRAYIELPTSAVGELHRVDDASLTQLYAWSPGGWGQSGTVVVQARQPLEAAPRRPVRNYAHPQLSSGGSYLGSNAGFLPPNPASEVTTYRALDIPPPDGVSATAGMIEWTTAYGGAWYNNLMIGNPAYLVPVVPGVSMTFSGYLWSPTTTTTPWTMLGVLWMDDKGIQLLTYPNYAVGAYTLLTSAPAKLSFTATPPATAVYAQFLVQQGIAGPVSYRMTGFQARLTSSPDESWPGQGATDPEWYDVDTVLLPADGAATVDIYDHAAPPGRVVQYSAVLSTLVGTETVVSPMATITSVYMTPPARNILKSRADPSLALAMWKDAGDTESYDEDTTELHAAGRDGDPIFSTSWRGGAKGSFTCHAVAALDFQRLLDIDCRQPVIIQWAIGGGQLYVKLTSKSVTYNRGYREVQFGYSEIAF